MEEERDERFINVGNYSYNMNEIKLLQPFFLQPMTKFGVRELGRITNVDTKTVMKYLQEFAQRRIVVKREEKGKFAYYEANRSSYVYRHEKSEAVVKEIVESGLIEYLEQELKPKTIVLFGSVQRGTYHAQSDVDLFVQADYRLVDTRIFRKKIGHNIQIIFETNLHKLSSGLLENIYNGMVLAGKLEVLRS